MTDLSGDVGNNAHQVFVSYVTADNGDAGQPAAGWITSFVELLQECLNRIPGVGDECAVWTDPASAEAGELTADLITRIENSPIGVVVLSPDYLDSAWCASRDSRAADIPAFLNLVQERQTGSGNCLFVVEKAETTGQQPPEFNDAPRYRFWVRPRNQATPVTFTASLDDTDFVDNLNDLALDIAREFRRAKKESQSAADTRETLPCNSANEQQAPKNHKATVFLAQAAADLNPLRKKVNRYLEQAGLRVVSASHSEGALADTQAVIEKNLAASDLFVQLLSYAEWDVSSVPQEDLAHFQYRRATEMDLPVMQWRNSELSAEDIEQDIENVDQRRLLLGSCVQAVDIEDFNREVVENAKPRTRTDSSERDNLDAYIFVNMQSHEGVNAVELCSYLDSRGIVYATVSNQGRPADIRKELTTTLLETDGMIVVYDQSDNRWIKPQLNSVRKILEMPFARSKNSNPKLVYRSPPGDKPHHGIQLRNMSIVDCAEGLDLDKLEAFLGQVEAVAHQRYEKIQQSQFVEKRDHYDVFLAHNSIDKPFVKELYTRLKERVIHPWLDESEIMPGSSFQEEIQEAIQKSNSAAILIGKNGLGPWQKSELHSLISRCIETGMRVIPVLLPGVQAIPGDLLFLKEYQWVSFENASDDVAIDRLVAGVKS